MEWYMWLIAAGVLVALGALVWVFFKFAKDSAASSVVGFVGGIAEGVAGMLPDDATKLDAHDVVLVVGRLAKKIPEWAKDPANAAWLDCKDEVLAFIEEQRVVIPHLAKLPADVLEKTAEALFVLAKAIPQVLSK